MPNHRLEILGLRTPWVPQIYLVMQSNRGNSTMHIERIEHLSGIEVPRRLMPRRRLAALGDISHQPFALDK